MLKRLLYLFLLTAPFVFFLSCKKEDLKSPTASFMVVSDVAVSTVQAQQGSPSHKITDIWFYVNGKYQGAYPVGKVMPIVAEGETEVILLPGIKNNGISSTRMPYPFYKGVKFNQAFESGKTYTISPTFEYQSGLNFFMDDFEGAGSVFQSVGDSAYMLVSNPALTYGGTGKSLFMGMSDAKPTAKMLSSIPINLPLSGNTIYLELDYKCNQEIIVGVVGYSNGTNDSDREAVVLTPTEGWNKIYVQLTTVVNVQPTFSAYKVFIKATKKVTNPEIYIDNVKLIYPQ